jgi:uncharacterized coiled-coil DUF342 family protein
MRQIIEQRVEQLRAEREDIVRRISELEQEAAHGRRLLSAYDGAIGELTGLLTMPDETAEMKE